jgi:uncharacterized protein YdiU (UPF0061 family)
MSLPTFSSRFTAELPGDPLTENIPRQVHGALWSPVKPEAVAAPQLLAASPEVLQLLGLHETQLQDMVPMLAGNALPPGGTVFAANYGGHQFGHWAGQLGDGRAMALGEVGGFELQLKGAGPTPYSRRGDGRAVLRSSIREFLCSEAMHHLGVPTTRALSLIRTGDQVVRDMFYDGNAAPEPGAIVCRVAPSFIRFGNFELCTARQDYTLLRQLLDFTIRHYFKELAPQAYGDLLLEVARRTARLMAHWQAVGFVHGVMNTDNMSILGLTIDYGPYGWVDDFNPQWTPNTTDAENRRYRFGNQPAIGLWNVERLAQAFSPVLDNASPVEEALAAYQDEFETTAGQLFCRKLGLAESPEAFTLVNSLFNWLAQEETDMTIFYRQLSAVILGPQPNHFPEALAAAFYGEPSARHLKEGLSWVQSWWQHARAQTRTPEVLASQLNAVNPKYVLRNYLAQQAIDAATEGDSSGVLELLDVMRRPFDEQPQREAFSRKRPEWARSKPGCSALSCSS